MIVYRYLFSPRALSQLDMTDFYDEDYDLDTDDDDDEQESNASEYADGDDSGNGET